MAIAYTNDNVNKEIGNNNTKYVQSANSIFHFMKKIDYLKTKIQEKCIIPRYTEEDTRYFNIQNMNSMAYPMICFCDIKLHKGISKNP